MLETNDYERNYAALPFENILREYRKLKTINVLKKYCHDSILEIGSGPTPLFMDFRDFKKMVVVEPGESFCSEVSRLAQNDPRLTVMNNLFEDVVSDLEVQDFDVIVIGGFLHEIDNPTGFINKLKEVCSIHTVVHSFVPNARSFHRLLAFEMGLIENVYEHSAYDKMFQRRIVFDKETYCDLFKRVDFELLETGTYFIKPFTHTQMNQMLSNEIVDDKVMDGLDKMIKYIPDMGAEIFVTCKMKAIS